MYQVNLARRLAAPAPRPAELRALYARLADATAAPFCAYLETGERTILSSSPERFLRSARRRGRDLPDQGHAPARRDAGRGRRAAAASCSRSAKDRAEHVMIVDLERNDLGRVCEIGSVRVPELCAPRSFSDVHHLVSSVRGRLRDPARLAGAARGDLPGRLDHGRAEAARDADHRRARALPRATSTPARSAAIDAAGGVELSIAIRTAVAARGELQLHLGGGIVADSDPERELAETRDKGRGFARSWGVEV